MKVWLNATGRLSSGHVLDVARKPFERALKDYDHLLYTRWNPSKVKGWGCWEIRRKPERPAVVDVVDYQGMSFVRLEHAELDIVNHVLDSSFLNYDLLRKIKEMDTFTVGTSQWIRDLESNAAKAQQGNRDKAKEAIKHAAKEYKREIKDYKELIASGLNPAQIARYWGKGTGS